MKNYFPKNGYLQTNRSNVLGNLWSSFNLDFKTNLSRMRLAKKLVTNTTSSDDANLGLPTAFEFYFDLWWAICGTRLFKNSSGELTSSFTQDTTGFSIGDSTTQFDVTNPSGTTFRYTYDTNGLDPGITSLTFPIGSIVTISGTNLAAGNRGTFTITGTGANYFEVTNAAGVAEINKIINTGTISIAGGSIGQDFSSNSDLKIFNLRLWATTATALWSKDSDVNIWIKRDTLNSGTLHNMVYFKKFNRLYYKNTNTSIKSIDSSDAIASSSDYFIDIGSSSGFITSMVAGSSSIWIGVQRINIVSSTVTSGLNGAINQWDGFSNQITNEYLLPTAGCLALTILDDIPYAIDSDERLLKYTGYTFKELARLPVGDKQLTNATAGSGRFIHFNGMQTTKNNTILVLINNLNQDANADINENLPSGIWECDLDTGSFTHKSSVTLKARSSSTITDYGQNKVLSVGALKINTLMSNSTNGRSTLICGFGYYTTASANKTGIFIDSPYDATTDNEGQKRGYFVTTWFESIEITDIWNRIWMTYRRFLNSNDKITLKYRCNEEDAVLATITWVDTTHFTTTTDITAYYPTASGFDGTYGGEVEILQGTGSGACVHITNVSLNSGTYTVTIDNAVIGVTTGTAKARFQKWLKLLPEITGQVLQYGQLPINVADVRIQIKGVMEFTGDDEFHKMAIFSNENLKITP